MRMLRSSKLPNVKIVTTSWDDGDPLDLKVAELLHLYGLGGTFYVPARGVEGHSLLEPRDLRRLVSEGFEAGAHGAAHRILTDLRGDELFQEITTCRNRLQDVLGQPVRMFFYPKGRFNHEVIHEVKRAGFLGARTTRMLSRKLDVDPFRMPTTIQVYRHGRSAYVRNILRAMNFSGAFEFVTVFNIASNWVELAKSCFDMLLCEGGVWHLYGHSWEIEELDLWDDLRKVLDYVGQREGVIYCGNAQVLSLAGIGAWSLRTDGAAERT